MKRGLGQVMTPHDLAMRAFELSRNRGRTLDPSSGTGVFLDLLLEAKGVELDPTIVEERHRDRTRCCDFFDVDVDEKYDTIIGNPPYVTTRSVARGRPIEHAMRQLPQLHSSVLSTSANLYLRFIEKAIRHLGTGGELVFIVPREFFTASSAVPLVNMMRALGAFTHVLFDVSPTWDAAVDTCVFRWEAGRQIDVVNVDGCERRVHESGGRLFFITHGPILSRVGDHFSASVGSRPRKCDVYAAQAPGLVQFAGIDDDVWCDISNSMSWPRYKAPTTSHVTRILFDEGPTRKQPYFRVSDCAYTTAATLSPIHDDIDVHEWCNKLNRWTHWGDVGVVINGRWRAGPTLIEAVPLEFG